MQFAGIQVNAERGPKHYDEIVVHPQFPLPAVVSNEYMSFEQATDMKIKYYAAQEEHREHFYSAYVQFLKFKQQMQKKDACNSNYGIETVREHEASECKAGAEPSSSSSDVKKWAWAPINAIVGYLPFRHLIFSFLSPQELCIAATASRFLYPVCTSNALWKYLFSRHFKHVMDVHPTWIHVFRRRNIPEKEKFQCAANSNQPAKKYEPLFWMKAYAEGVRSRLELKGFQTKSLGNSCGDKYVFDENGRVWKDGKPARISRSFNFYTTVSLLKEDIGQQVDAREKAVWSADMEEMRSIFPGCEVVSTWSHVCVRYQWQARVRHGQIEKITLTMRMSR